MPLDPKAKSDLGPTLSGAVDGQGADPPQEPQEPESGRPADSANNSQVPEEKKLYAGKYESIEAMEASVSEKDRHIAEIHEENARLRAAMTATTPSQPEPPKNSVLEEFEQHLSDIGVPKEVTRGAIREVVGSSLEDFNKPLIEASEAERWARERMPEASKFERELEKFYREDKETRTLVDDLVNAGKFKAAKLLLWQNFREVKGPELEAALRERVDAEDAARKADKVNAGRLNTQKSHSRRPENAEEAESQKIAAGFRHYQQTGDDRPYWSSVLGPGLDKMLKRQSDLLGY